MRTLIFINLILAFSFLGSCHTDPKTQTFKNEIIIASGYPIGAIDPFTSGKGIGANLIELIYRPLFRIGSNNEIIPEYAQNVQWKNHGTILEITLDKSQIDDVTKTFQNSIQNNTGGFGHLNESLKSIEQVSSTQLDLHFKNFDQGILYILSNLPMVEYTRPEKASGLFRNHQKNDSMVVLQRKSSSKDKVNQITFKNYPSTRRAIRDFVAGSVDFIISADETDFDVLKNLPEIDIAYLNTTLLYKLLKGPKYPAKQYKSTWAILQSNLFESHLFADEENRFVPAYLPVPKTLPWYEEVERFVRPGTTHINNFQTTLTSPQELNYLGSQAKDQKVALKLKRFLETYGYKIQLADLSSTDFEKKVFVDKNFSLALIPYAVKEPIFSNYLVFHTAEGNKSLNISGYSNPKLDALLEKARYNPNPEESKKAFFLAMQELMNNPPALFLFWVRTPLVYRKSCQGFSLDADKFFSSLKDVRCEP